MICKSHRLLTSGLLLFCSSIMARPLLTIAVTASFEPVFNQLAPLFEAAQGIKLRGVFASSGQLSAQIVHGAPYDLFLSANHHHVLDLIKKGFVKSSNVLEYAVGELVLVSASKKDPDPIKALTDSHIKTIALANPNSAPYGLAARQTLIRKHVWSRLKTKLILGESTGQVGGFLCTGSVDAGFVARSQWLAMQNQQACSTRWGYEVPESLHAPIRHFAAILRNSSSKKTAKLFLNFLVGKKARGLIEANGYHF